VLTVTQLLVGLHIWTSTESYEVLGVFGPFSSLPIARLLIFASRLVLRRLLYGTVPGSP
jgi:hypothetical protein